MGGIIYNVCYFDEYENEIKDIKTKDVKIAISILQRVSDKKWKGNIKVGEKIVLLT